MQYETPIAMDQLTRFFTEALDLTNLHAVPHGMQSFFGNPGVGGRTRYVTDAKTLEFDVRDGVQDVTTLVHRGTTGTIVNKAKLIGGKFTSFNRAFPLGEDEGIVSADQILERSFGEGVGSTALRIDRMRSLSLDIVSEMVRRAIRTQERLAWQMLRTGKMDTIIGTSSSDEQIDTKRAAANTLTKSGDWATAGTSIVGDFDSACDLIIQNGGLVPDACIVGSDIPKYLEDNTAIKARAAVQGAGTSGFEVAWIGENVKVGAQFQRMVDNGFNPIARIRTYKGRTITVFTYEGGYVTGGVFYPFITSDHAVWFSSAARCDRYFGPPERLPMTAQDRQDYAEIFGFPPESTPMPPNVPNSDVIAPAEFYFDSRRSADGKSLILRCQWAPVYITTDTNAFVYCDTH
jgi:hypothetical protein